METFTAINLGLSLVSITVATAAIVIVSRTGKGLNDSLDKVTVQLMAVKAAKIANEIVAAASRLGLPEGSVIEVSPDLSAILTSSPLYEVGSEDEDYGSLHIWRVSISDVEAGAACLFKVGDHSYVFRYNV